MRGLRLRSRPLQLAENPTGLGAALLASCAWVECRQG